MFSIGCMSYGKKNPEPQQYAPGVTNVNFDDPEFYKHYANPQHMNYQNILNFIEAIGICHTVIAETKKNKDGKEVITFNASSPDELALVNGARHMGFAFRERDEEGNLVIDVKRPNQEE